MRALFERKIENIVDLREATVRSRKSGIKGTVYTVDREVEITNEVFREF
jgi:nitric oxide reductase activation protein